MSRYKKEPEPESPRPKGHPGCICSGHGMVTVMSSSKFAGTTPWKPGESYWYRSHTTTVLCPCPVGQWMHERHTIGGDKCPWQVYDQRTMILAEVFEKALHKWLRGESDVQPVVTPQDVPVEQLSRSPMAAYDSTDEWLSPAAQPDLFPAGTAA